MSVLTVQLRLEGDVITVAMNSERGVEVAAGPDALVGQRTPEGSSCPAYLPG